MRRIVKLGKALATLTTALAFAAVAQIPDTIHPTEAPSRAPIPLQHVRGILSDRIAESEWTRGCREGYELGLWVGVHDAKSFLPPNERPPGQNNRARLTRYRQGYLARYSAGCRSASTTPGTFGHPCSGSRVGIQNPSTAGRE
jgi:hypothetical protein